MEKNQKPEPCPCCGAPSEDIAIRRKELVSEVAEINGEIYWYVECLPCDLQTGKCFDSDAKRVNFKDGREMAIAKWNLRKAPETK